MLKNRENTVMKIMLTGASGNLGRELIRQAAFEFVQVNRDDWNDLDDKFESGIDVVIHAASDLHTRVAASPSRLLDSNLMSTARILEAVRKHAVPRFVFISSCSVYGEDMRTGEGSKCCPVSINGIGKLLNEKLIEDFCAGNGIKYEILRIFNLYGGNDQFSILSHIKRSLQNNQPFVLNNQGVAQRDFIHVTDVAGVILFLLKNGMPHTHLNIGTGLSTKISTLVELVARRFPDFKIVHRNVEEAEYSRADISRLAELVKWEFLSIENYMRDEFMSGV